MVATPNMNFSEICSIDCDFAWHNMLGGAPRQRGVWHSTHWTLATSSPDSGRCCEISFGAIGISSFQDGRLENDGTCISLWIMRVAQAWVAPRFCWEQLPLRTKRIVNLFSCSEMDGHTHASPESLGGKQAFTDWTSIDENPWPWRQCGFVWKLCECEHLQIWWLITLSSFSPWTLPCGSTHCQTNPCGYFSHRNYPLPVRAGQDPCFSMQAWKPWDSAGSGIFWRSTMIECRIIGVSVST